METKTHRCHYCGKSEEGFNGPVEPVDPNNPPMNEPPGSGYYLVYGPSNGMGYDDPARMYCSPNHLARVEERGEKPIVAASEPAIRGWKPFKQSKPPHPHSKALMRAPRTAP